LRGDAEHVVAGGGIPGVVAKARVPIVAGETMRIVVGRSDLLNVHWLADIASLSIA